MSAPSTILHKRNSNSGVVPATASLSAGELAINTADGKLFIKTTDNTVKTFLNAEQQPYTLDTSLSSSNCQYGLNTVTGILAGVLGGVNNDVSGAGSTVINGSDNDIDADYALIGNGSNNTILTGGDFGAILGGVNNTLNHSESFILGSNITSHLSGFTYVNNLSVLGKIYGDGSSLTGITGGGGGSGDENVNTLVRSNSATWDIIGDRYFTTSISTNSINKGTKVFAVSANLSYIPTQDITIVLDHDASRHMHGTVLDYNSSTGSLTADINSHTGSGSYSNWKINLGGVPTFVDYLVGTNNLSDVSSPSTALANLSGVSKTELQSLSASWSPIRKFDMVYSPNTISYSGTATGGSLTSQSAWTIIRITYTTSGTVSAQGTVNNAIWDNRLSLTYV